MRRGLSVPDLLRLALVPGVGEALHKDAQLHWIGMTKDLLFSRHLVYTSVAINILSMAIPHWSAGLLSAGMLLYSSRRLVQSVKQINLMVEMMQWRRQ